MLHLRGMTHSKQWQQPRVAPTPPPPELSQIQIDRIAANFLDYSPDVLSTALIYNPGLKSGQTFIDMQNDFAEAIADGALQASGWSTTEIQNPLWLMFDNAGKNNTN